MKAPLQTTLLSILLPTRNQARWLRGCIRGIRFQSWPHWELLVVNDASTDGTASFLRQQARRDFRIRVFHFTRSRGPVFALEYLRKRTAGTFIWGVASDDFCFRRDFLEEGFAQLARHPMAAGFCSSCETRYEPSGNPGPRLAMRWGRGFHGPEKVVRGFYRHHGNIPGASIILKKEWLEQLGGYRRDLGPMCDLFVNHAAAARAGIVYLARPAVCVRILQGKKSFGQSSTPRQWAGWLAKLEALLRPHFPPLPNQAKHWSLWRIRRINDFLQVEHRLRLARQAEAGQKRILRDDLNKDLATLIEILRRELARRGLSDAMADATPEACLRFPWQKPLQRLISRGINSLRKRWLGFSLPE